MEAGIRKLEGRELKFSDWPGRNLAIRPVMKKFIFKRKEKVCLATSIVDMKAAAKRWAKTTASKLFHLT